MPDFSAQIRDWVKKTEGAAEAIFRQSAQDVINLAQTPVGDGGNMPVDTGMLRASIQTSVDSVAAYIPKEGDTDHDAATNAAILAIATAGLDDEIVVEWTANYARYVHDGYTPKRSNPEAEGAKSVAGRKWVTLAAMEWQAIVNANTDRLKGLLKR